MLTKVCKLVEGFRQQLRPPSVDETVSRAYELDARLKHNPQSSLARMLCGLRARKLTSIARPDGRP